MESGAEYAVYSGSVIGRGNGRKAREKIFAKLKRWEAKHPEVCILEYQIYLQVFGVANRWEISTVLVFKFKQVVDC